MSQLLQVATRQGAIKVLNSFTLAPDYFDQGIPFDNVEGGVLSLAVDITGDIHHFHQGLPFTLEGRLAATQDKPVEYFGSGGAPFDALGRLVFGSGAVDHFSAGIPYTADRQIAAGIT